MSNDDKNFVQKPWKSFLECEKIASSTRIEFFHVYIINKKWYGFFVQFEINLHLWVFQNAEIVLAEVTREISAFWKTHSCKLIPNWNRNRMIIYTIKTAIKASDTLEHQPTVWSRYVLARPMSWCSSFVTSFYCCCTSKHDTNPSCTW